VLALNIKIRTVNTQSNKQNQEYEIKSLLSQSRNKLRPGNSLNTRNKLETMMNARNNVAGISRSIGRLLVLAYKAKAQKTTESKV